MMLVRIVLLMACGVAATTPAPRLSNRDLKILSELLWAKKGYYFREGYDYNITDTPSAGTKFFKKGEFNEALLQSGTWPAFMNLLDNYNHELGVEETESAEKTMEENEFLDAILDTDVMDTLWNALLITRLVTGTKYHEFKNMLKQYWFQTYSRFGNGPPDSSGFEHVFVGEIYRFDSNDAMVMGFHNWMRFYLEEKRGSLSISGQQKTCQPVERELEFTWHGVWKLDPATKETGLSTVLFGVNPEFEMGLYTLCFLARPNEICNVRYGGAERTIQTVVQTGPPPSAAVHVGTSYTIC